MIWVILFIGLSNAIPFYFTEAWDSNNNFVLNQVNASDNIYAQSTSNPYWVNGTFYLPIYNPAQIGDVYAGCEFSGIGTSFFLLRNVSLDWYNRSSGRWESACSLYTFLTTSDRWIVCNVTQLYYYDILNFQTLEGTTSYFRCNIRGGIGLGVVRIDRLAAALYGHICTNITVPAYYVMEYDLYGATINVTYPYPGKACINIQTSNVVLDCQGHTISGINDLNTTYGILANNVTNVTLLNCNITNYTYNAFFDSYSSNILIANNSFNLSKNASVVFNWHTYNVLSENNTFDKSPTSIWLMNALFNISIFNNVFHESDNSILAYNTHNLNMSSNNFSSNNYSINANYIDNFSASSNNHNYGVNGYYIINSRDITIQNDTSNLSYVSFYLFNISHISIFNWTSFTKTNVFTILRTYNISIYDGYSAFTDTIIDGNETTDSQFYNIYGLNFNKYAVRLRNGDNSSLHNISLRSPIATYGIYIDGFRNISINNTSIAGTEEAMSFNYVIDLNVSNLYITAFENVGIRLINEVINMFAQHILIFSGGASSMGIQAYSSKNVFFNNTSITSTYNGIVFTSTTNTSFDHSEVYSILGTCIYAENADRFLYINGSVFSCYRGSEVQQSSYIYFINNTLYDNIEGFWANNSIRINSYNNYYFNNQIYHYNLTNSRWIRSKDIFFNSSVGFDIINSREVRSYRSRLYNHTLAYALRNSTLEVEDNIVQNGTIAIYANNSSIVTRNLTITDFMLGMYGLFSQITNSLLYVSALSGAYWWDGSILLNNSNTSSRLALLSVNSSLISHGFIDFSNISLVSRLSNLSLENTSILNAYIISSVGTLMNVSANLVEISYSNISINSSQINETPTYNSSILASHIKGYNISLIFDYDSNISNSIFTNSSIGVIVAFGNNTTLYENAIENNTRGVYISVPTNRSKYFGFSYVDWNNEFPLENVSKDVERMKWLGVDHINLVVQLIQSTNTSSDVQLKPGTSLSHLNDVISYIKSQNIRVCIYPLLITSDGRWRGEIRPSDLTTWFNNYQTILTNLASLNPDCLYVGSEYEAFQNESTYWQNLITTLRTSYTGKLYYGFNWYDALYTNSYENLSWIHLLDELGISFYTPLASCSDPFDLSLMSNNLDNDIYPRIERMHNNTTMPISFSEIGYRSTNNAYCLPYEWTYSNNYQNLTRQALLHALILNKTRSWPNWFKGETIWYYEINNIYRWDGFGVTNKPAEFAIRKIITEGPSLSGNMLLQDNGNGRNIIFLYQWMLQSQSGAQFYTTNNHIKVLWNALVEKPTALFSFQYTDVSGDNILMDLSIDNYDWVVHVTKNGGPYYNAIVSPFTPGIHSYGFEINGSTAYVIIDKVAHTFSVTAPYKFQSWGVLGSWDSAAHTSIALYNMSVELINPDTNQKYIAYNEGFLGGTRGWLYYDESESYNLSSGSQLLISYISPRKVEPQSLGLSHPVNITFYNNSICFNTLDTYSTFNYTAGILNRCDLFLNWWEMGRPGCSYTCSRIWDYLYGNVSYYFILASQGDSGYLSKWPAVFENATLFVVDYDSSIHWDRLVALTRDQSNTFISGNNDFAEADTALNLIAFPVFEHISTKWGGGSSSIPVMTQSFHVMGNVINGVPVTPSAPGSTSFYTGILWDGFYNTHYTGSEPLVFATKILKNTTDLYGTYDYLITIPYTLSMLEGSHDVVSVYVYVE